MAEREQMLEFVRADGRRGQVAVPIYEDPRPGLAQDLADAVDFLVGFYRDQHGLEPEEAKRVIAASINGSMESSCVRASHLESWIAGRTSFDAVHGRLVLLHARDMGWGPHLVR